MTPPRPRRVPSAVVSTGLVVLLVLFLVWVDLAEPFRPTSQAVRVERAVAAVRATSATADAALAGARELHPGLTFTLRDPDEDSWSICAYDQFGLGAAPTGVSWTETRTVM